jgi:hypothetical protein
MCDSSSHRDSVYYWAQQLQSPYGDLLWANLLVQDSLLDSANNVYNNIPAKYTALTGAGSLTGDDLNEFSAWGRWYMNILISVKQHGDNLTGISSAAADSLQTIVDSGKMWAHERAANWLRLYDGRSIQDTLLFPDMTGLDTTAATNDTCLRKVAPVQAASIAQSTGQLYPNPVHDLLKINYNAADNTAMVQIQIWDISGRLLMQQAIQANGTTGINTSSLAPGMYLYKISENGHAKMQGKIGKD